MRSRDSSTRSARCSGLDLDRLIDTLSRHDIRARIPDALAFARERQVFLGMHEPSGTPVDVSLAWLPFEEEALPVRRAIMPVCPSVFPVRKTC